MSVNLTKGQNVKLTKGVQQVRVGLSWDANTNGGADFDLDAIAIELTSKDGQCVGDDFLVFYNSSCKVDGKPTDPTHAVVHSGDNLTGDGDGDDETITVDFNKLDPRVNAILFIVNIYQARERGQNFGQVKNPKARLYYSNTDIADLVYELDEEFSTQTTMEFCMLYKHNDEWKFKALGDANCNNLIEELHKYGIPATGNA